MRGVTGEAFVCSGESVGWMLDVAINITLLSFGSVVCAQSVNVFHPGIPSYTGTSRMINNIKLQNCAYIMITIVLGKKG